MYKDELTAVTVMQTEDGDNYELSYYIRVFDSSAGSVPARSYALRVDMHDKSSGRLIETEDTPAFSEDYVQISRLARRFAEGQVPPCTLVEMCDEWCEA
jgi:hypothetical protein